MLFYTITILLLFQLTAYHAVDSTWWFMNNFNKNSVSDPKLLCKVLPINKKQQNMCARRADLIFIIGESTRRTISECQYQFHSEKWNCSIFERDPSVFGKQFLKGGTRELSFVQAMASSSAVYSLSKVCLSGFSACRCKLKGQDLENSALTNNDFKWRGCDGSGVDFSLRFVRRFTNAEEGQRKDVKARVNRHNNRAGREIFLKHSYFSCKCHGVSGSCTMRSCWRLLPNIREIGNTLKDKYDGAIKITLTPSSRLVPADPLQKKPQKMDLVYYEESPDYCSFDMSKGIIGTGSRICNETSDGGDSCDILCCNRGYDSHRISVTSRCMCTFHWCCNVTCKTCHEWKSEARCKPVTMSSVAPSYTSNYPRKDSKGKFDNHLFPWRSSPYLERSNYLKPYFDSQYKRHERNPNLPSIANVKPHSRRQQKTSI